MEMLLKIIEAWGGKAVEDLRLAAVMEETGVCFDAVRVPGGKRVVLAVCATGYDQIRLLREAWRLSDAEASPDWHSLTAGEMVLRASRSPAGWAYAAMDGGSEWLALYLVGVGPDSITILESGFGMDAT